MLKVDNAPVMNNQRVLFFSAANLARWVRLHELIRESVEPPQVAQFKHLTLDQALQVYRLGNQHERQLWLGPLMEKWTRADPITKARNLEAFKQVLKQQAVPHAAAAR